MFRGLELKFRAPARSEHGHLASNGWTIQFNIDLGLYTPATFFVLEVAGTDGAPPGLRRFYAGTLGEFRPLQELLGYTGTLLSPPELVVGATSECARPGFNVSRGGLGESVCLSRTTISIATPIGFEYHGAPFATYNVIHGQDDAAGMNLADQSKHRALGCGRFRRRPGNRPAARPATKRWPATSFRHV